MNGLNVIKREVSYKEFGEDIVFFDQVSVESSNGKYIILILD
jgi:hypothetical protein